MIVNKQAQQARVTTSMTHKKDQIAPEYKVSIIERNTNKSSSIAEQLLRRKMRNTIVKSIKNTTRNTKYRTRPRNQPESSKYETYTDARLTKVSMLRYLTGENRIITVQIDVLGPIGKTTYEGKQYLLTMVTTLH